MASKACSPDAAVLPHRKKGVLKKFYFRHIHPSALRWFQAAALLEYPERVLGTFDEGTVNHHYAEWDEVYRRCGGLKPGYDLWLEKYDGVLKDSKNIPIIDLGCGYGNDTLFLHERGYKVISCDLSMEALKRLDHFIDKPVIRHFDMLAGLPFDNNSAKIVIADLSIHYFPWKETARIVEEIRRVLTNDGYLLCRVNSAKDIQCDAREGVKIEENYYDLGGRKKRYFEMHHLKRLFRAWDICHIEEYSFERFGSIKVIWEVAIKKN